MNMAPSTVSDSPSPPPRVRVLVADDHEVMRLGIRNLLEVHPGWSICAEANNGQEAVEKTLREDIPHLRPEEALVLAFLHRRLAEKSGKASSQS